MPILFLTLKKYTESTKGMHKGLSLNMPLAVPCILCQKQSNIIWPNHSMLHNNKNNEFCTYMHKVIKSDPKINSRMITCNTESAPFFP